MQFSYQRIFAKSWRRKPALLLGALVFVSFLTNTGLTIPPALAASTISQVDRLAGTDRYATAVQIAKAGWTTAASVVLARGDDFPDALAGSTLAHAANGPLLLTDSKQLPASVLTEIKALQPKRVYILGGTGAISTTVQNTLTAANFSVKRISGTDRYDTAAKIAGEVRLINPVGSTQAFLVSGSSYADALSISAYAAAKGIPLLLTGTSVVPQTSLNALKTLGVTQVTLIGGTGVITSAVPTQLAKAGITVAARLSGSDRYQTNTTVLNTLSFDTSKCYVATGTTFPDALAGSALAAVHNNPILLVSASNLPTVDLTYLSNLRNAGSSFTLLGGFGAISYGVERTVSTGITSPYLSLQYIHGLSLDGMTNRLNAIPGTASNYVDLVSPDWFTLSGGGTSFTTSWTDTQCAQFVATAHAKNLKVLPLINSSWSSTTDIEGLLHNSTNQTNVINALVQKIQTIKADGVVIDFEHMSGSDAPYLTQFMHTLYAKMHSVNKLAVMAVMPRTAGQTWSTQFDYHNLAPNVDYLNIMTYDYSTSTPGPIAPLGWIKNVLTYTQGQGVDMDKVLMGVPYYGRDWQLTSSDSYYNPGINLTTALATASSYGSKITRETSAADPVGIPTYKYTDSSKNQHTVYFDDTASWSAKLALVNQYHLGGMAGWSLYWVDSSTAAQLYPLLQKYLR